MLTNIYLYNHKKIDHNCSNLVDYKLLDWFGQKIIEMLVAFSFICCFSRWGASRRTQAQFFIDFVQRHLLIARYTQNATCS